MVWLGSFLILTDAVLSFFLYLFFLILLFRAAPVAYGDSQAGG